MIIERKWWGQLKVETEGLMFESSKQPSRSILKVKSQKCERGSASRRRGWLKVETEIGKLKDQNSQAKAS